MPNHYATSVDPDWFKAHPTGKNTYLEIRINRNTLVAIIVSLAIHAALLFFYIQAPMKMNMGEPNPNDQPISVVLNPITTPKPHVKASKPQAVVKHLPPNKKILTAKPTTSPASAPAVISATASSVPAPTPPSNAAPSDMSSYINAVRARRAAESGAVATDAEPQPSADDIRMANIKRNLQPPGGGGLFQIMRVGNDTASFVFRGWGNTYTSPLKEMIYVSADANTDIQHAIIRKMISIIRTRQTGDFTWESTNGRVVTLSARLQDNVGLEDFLLNEFFRTGRKPSEQ